MSKRITNLRAKPGKHFYIDDGDIRIRDDDAKEDDIGSCIIEVDEIEFDVVVPEYQVGDVVAIRQKPGDDLKGFITYKYDHEDQGEILLVAVADKSSPWKFYVEDNATSLGGWQIVGLWDEREEQ